MLRVATPAHDDRDRGRAAQRRRHERRWRCQQEREQRGELVGRRGGQLVEQVQQLFGPRRRIHHHPGEDISHRVQAELEAGDHTKIPTAAAQRPEQIGIVVSRRPDDSAVGEHDFGSNEVVDCQAVFAHQPSDAAAERQPADAGVRD